MHMTSEGLQLQNGLRHSGWSLAGYGYIDNCANVRQLLERYRPDRVFIQDCRDWRADSGGCFNKKIHYDKWESLKRDGVKSFTVCKDAGTVSEYQRKFADDIGASAILVYYHEQSVTELSPWLKNYKLIRIYHSFDGDLLALIDIKKDRKPALVSGAVSGVYPTRQTAISRHIELGLDVLAHPGYGNKKSYTKEYLDKLSEYRVHLACSSSYKFALRKIIESVAVGCIPVTDLPEYDRLPVIDDFLVRIPQSASFEQIKDGLAVASGRWSQDLANKMQQAAVSFYDYRDSGERMSIAMKGV